MATTYVQPGDTMELAAPTGGVTAGLVYAVGGFLGVATATATATTRTNFVIRGVHLLPKVTAETWTEGQAAYWDLANTKVSTDESLGLPIGTVALAGTSSDTTGYVRLNGTSIAGRVLNIRKRFTIAQVNAGATLLGAVLGGRIRMVSATGISIGGAAGAVTTVDILGTVTTARKLVAFAQASLTQSTVLKDGGTGAAVLADGASYTPNDISTAVTVGITGSAITTATHIDFNFNYQIE